MTVAAHFPAPLRAAAHEVVSSAFMAGLHRGSLVAAGAAAAAGLVALLFVPARAASDDLSSVAQTDPADSARPITTPIEV